MDSDVENIPDELPNQEDEFELFEPAGEMEIEDEVEESDDDKEEVVSQSKRQKHSHGHPDSKWKQTTTFFKELPSESLKNFADNHQHLLGKSPFDLWKLYFSDDLLTTLVTQNNLHVYARRDKNDQDFEVSISKLCRFLGILIFSGYHTVPSERDYWSNKRDSRIQLVSEALSSQHYLKIKASFYLVDNRTLTSADSKMAKILSLYVSLNASLIQFGIFDKNLSIDESMVPYFGGHSCKMFIRGKPICFGYILWCLCGSNDYPYKLSIYTGKDPNSAENSAPLGTRVVKNMVNTVNFGYKRFRYKGFSLIRDYAKGPK